MVSSEHRWGKDPKEFGIAILTGDKVRAGG